MTTSNRIKNLVSGLSQAVQRLTRSALKGIVRLFEPTDDNYPKTGVQPFEGEPLE